MELTGQIYTRPDRTLGFDDDDQYSQYHTKFQAELGWNIFNSSLLYRKSELKLIDLNNKQLSLAQIKQKRASLEYLIEQDITENFNYQTAIVLYNQLKNIDILNLAYQYTLEKDRISNDKLLDVINEKMRIEYTLMQICSVDSIKDMPLCFIRPTVIEVDTIGLFNNILTDNFDIQAASIKEDVLDTRKKLTNYTNGMRFTPFVRASHYLRTTRSSSNIDLGVRFTFPLYDETSHKRKSLQVEKTLTSMDKDEIVRSTKADCIRLLQYLQRLNAAVETEYFHQKQLTEFIKIRKQAYKSSTKGYNHIVRLEEYNEYLKSWERMYKLMYQRNTCLLDIIKTSGCMELDKLIIEKAI